MLFSNKQSGIQLAVYRKQIQLQYCGRLDIRKLELCKGEKTATPWLTTKKISLPLPCFPTEKFSSSLL